MAKERYINADTLITNLYSIPPVYLPTSYSSSSIEQAFQHQMQQYMSQYHNMLISGICGAINNAATLDGPCMLCRQKDGEELPPNTYTVTPRAG